jgi:hypothetical protein
MSETLEGFFKCLAERLCNENSLSDVTYALAKTSPRFMSVLMSEFFEFDFAHEPYEIEREQPSVSGRPDFVVRQNGYSYLIENKIYDCNCHFRQYYEGYKDEIPCKRQGFITNYCVDYSTIKNDFKGVGIAEAELQEIRKRTKTWAELVELLEERISEFPDDEQSVIGSYLEYVRRVCQMEKLQKVGDLSNLSNLHNFNILVEHVVENTVLRSDVVKAPYPAKTREHGDSWSGKYMRLNSEGRATLYPTIGIWFGREQQTPGIYLSFEQDWNSTLYDAMKDQKLVGQTFVFGEHDGQLLFDLKTDIKSFVGQGLELQKQTLEIFLNEVVTDVIPFWK